MTDRFKDATRKTWQLARTQLSQSYQQEASQDISFRIKALKQYRAAERIALYQAVNGEVDLNALWRSADIQKKRCYFPAINADQTLSFLPVTPDTPWIQNQFGIREPDLNHALAIAPQALDIIFVPLTVFDKQGTRLGMGGGYYDRTLAVQRAALLIGVAYEFQRLPFLKPQPWDVPLDAIITQRRIDWSKPHDSILATQI